jgi:hypothetical protein
MQKLSDKYFRFMQGRNGFDAYNKFLLIIGLINDLISVFFGSYFLILADIFFFYALFRCLSRNIVKRSMENQSYLVIQNWLRHLWKAWTSNLKDREHKYYVCPQCHQIVRVPRGKGTITVTCPTCGKEFSRKS